MIKNIKARNSQTGEIKSFRTLDDFKEFFTDYKIVLAYYNDYTKKTGDKSFLKAFDFNWNCFRTNEWAILQYSNPTANNRKTKEKANGEGSIYWSEKLQCWVAQYVEPSGKRKTLTQRKNEKVTDFKNRFKAKLSEIAQGTYIEKSEETARTIIEEHIAQKFADGITRGSSYKRDKETLEQICSCCSNFINKSIQDVTLRDIQRAKENMKKYKQSGINRMWRLLTKAFSIASSPSVKLIPFNIMKDENLKKPLSSLETTKVPPLTKEERVRLAYVLDNEERNHKYRNIVKLEWLTAMRIGEVLARSRTDIVTPQKLHIHNTLTEDDNGNTILGEHTKTYNKQTGIDEGERYFPITQEISEILKESLNTNLSNMHNLVYWDYEKNTFVADTSVNAWLRRINQKYHISNKSLHNHRLRHDRITQWRESGMTMEAIQYLAGHVEGSDVTNDYIDISQEFAFEEFKKAN